MIDEDRTLSEVRVQGESLQIDAVERVLLSVDQVAAVRVEVNGEPFPIVPDEESEGVRDLEILAPEPDEGAGGQPDGGSPAESTTAGSAVEADEADRGEGSAGESG